VDGRVSWLESVGRHRAGIVGAERDGAQAKIDTAPFGGTLVSEKVLAKVGATFGGAIDRMVAVAEIAARLETHRAAQLSGVLDKIYGAMGRLLEASKDDARAVEANACVGALDDFVRSIGPSAELVPALATLASMIEPKGERDRAPVDRVNEATRTLLDFTSRLAGREGATHAVFVHRHALEMLERRTRNLRESQRAKLWQLASDLVLSATPLTGTDPSRAARIAAALGSALEKEPPAKAVASAKASLLADALGHRDAILGQLDAVPPGLEAGEPRRAYDAWKEALVKVLDASPAGPPELYGAVEILAVRAHEMREHIARAPAAWIDLAAVVDAVATTPAVRAVLDHLTYNVPGVLDVEAGKNAIGRAARANDADEIPFELLVAHAAQHGGQAEGVEDAVRKWAKLPPGAALRASLALMSHLPAPNVAAALAPHLGRLALEKDMVELTAFGKRFAFAFPRLERKLGADAGPVAAALARHGADVPVASINRAAEIAAAVRGILKNLPLDAILEPTKRGAPGLLALVDAGAYGQNPLPCLYGLLKAIAAKNLGAEAQATLARLAIGAAVELGKLDRDPMATDFPRILEDWTRALAEPGALTFVRSPGAVAIRAKEKSIPQLFALHAMPSCVGVTASLHLGAKTLGWLMTRIEATRSHAQIRALRDLVFAAVAAGRIDLVDACARAKSDGAVANAIDFVAQQHRIGKIADLPIDRIIEGLAAGRDPAAEILEERAQGGGVGRVAGQQDPAGTRLLASIEAETKALLAFFPDGKTIYEADTAIFKEPLQLAIQTTSSGEWPAPKYTGEVADRQLGGLTQEQREIWAREDITPAGAKVALDDPRLDGAMKLLAGLAKALPKQIDLGVEWSRASLDALSKERNALIAELRGKEKGTAEHRALSRAIAPLGPKVALLELFVALEGQKAGDARKTLLELKALVLAAMPAARRAPGVLEALRRIAEVQREIRAPGRTGVYAADEDRLDAYLTSFGGSCINPANGQNRGSLVELIMSAQYKMGRIMNGNTCTGRTIFRLLRVELPNGYRGYALRMDKPLDPKNWGNSPPEDQLRLMFEHGLRKAAAMGIPFMINQPEHVKALAEGLGLQVEDGVAVKLWVDKGHTGMHHNQGMFSGDYFIGWPGLRLGQKTVAPAKPDDLTVERTYSMSVVMPRGFAPA
jgi:hypothetical protein